MLKETELRMLAAFFPEGKERTTREIEVRSGYSHERAYSTLKGLEKRGVLRKRMVGKTLAYSVSSFDDCIYMAFVHHSIKRKENWAGKYPAVHKAIEELRKGAKPELMIVFGSYAHGEAKQASDVDVLCVGGNEVEKTAPSLRHKYNLRINPVAVTRSVLGNISEENPEFWEDLVNFGVAINGWEIFYRVAYAGE
jgi:predicted nucleotidyltransferase